MMTYHTKADFLRAFESLIAPIREELIRTEGTPDFGHTATVYSQDAIHAEAFLRPLWGLAPYWHGGHGDEELKAAMRHGIICGTDPASPHYWGVCGRYDQRFVEMAPLAFSMLLTPEVVWDPLTDEERDHLCAWMWQINENVIPNNNWRFFRILTNIAMKHLSRPYSRERLEEDLAAIENFYMSHGWYHDGPCGQRDYYVAWAFHYYGLVYACFENDAYAEKYRERARVFAEDFIYWFSDSGAAVPYGRSLTYRMAQGSFWSMCLLADVEVYDYGVVKGMVSRHLSDWLSRPITGFGGELSIGYYYPNLMMAEHYNAPGSPYWATKFFAMLALDDDHPIWQTEEKPLPHLTGKKLLREADMLVTRHRGDVFAYPAGTIENAAFCQSAAKYLRFAYSTRFGFQLKLGDSFSVEALADSTLMFDVGGVFCDRRHSFGHELTEDHLVIRWSPMDGIRVTTTITPTETAHTRHHVIESDFTCVAYDCGFAVACRDGDACSTRADGTVAEAHNAFSLCRVLGTQGEAVIVNATPNANVLYNKTVIPAIKYVIPRGVSELTTVVEID